jgi:phosphatidylethanolamine-binding protein (PEBP) family uncharacterized protein
VEKIIFLVEFNFADQNLYCMLSPMSSKPIKEINMFSNEKNKQSYFFIFLLAAVTILFHSSAFAAGDHKISFMNPIWDGKRIPIGMQCSRQGGDNPHTPKLKVTNLPKGTSYLRMVISDESYGGAGFHGIFKIKVPTGASEIVIPGIYETTEQLPSGIELEKGNGSPAGGRGHYLPPCSGNRNHTYTAEILAYNDSDEKLKENYIDFGKY